MQCSQSVLNFFQHTARFCTVWWVPWVPWVPYIFSQITAAVVPGSVLRRHVVVPSKQNSVALDVLLCFEISGKKTESAEHSTLSFFYVLCGSEFQSMWLLFINFNTAVSRDTTYYLLTSKSLVWRYEIPFFFFLMICLILLLLEKYQHLYWISLLMMLVRAHKTYFILLLEQRLLNMIFSKWLVWVLVASENFIFIWEVSLPMRSSGV